MINTIGSSDGDGREGYERNEGQKTMELIYLASPYSHPDSDVRRERFQAAVDIVAASMKSGKCVIFSPIVHSHLVSVSHDLPKDWKFWSAVDELMISKCDRLYVLTIDGWKDSVGVAAEIGIARKLNIPVEYIGTSAVFA